MQVLMSQMSVFFRLTGKNAVDKIYTFGTQSNLKSQWKSYSIIYTPYTRLIILLLSICTIIIFCDDEWPILASLIALEFAWRTLAHHTRYFIKIKWSNFKYMPGLWVHTTCHNQIIILWQGKHRTEILRFRIASCSMEDYDPLVNDTWMNTWCFLCL